MARVLRRGVNELHSRRTAAQARTDPDPRMLPETARRVHVRSEIVPT